ncbi:hypothetical protein GGQ85_003620 [Nitrobacter vulgaris]|uniref:hypothetical protein n=1 Tax=Nitrobacter vulgaris TaxID=29421 RepID=UPI002865A3F2|nr:hypothetical protein [Nitrobacter vulgaris]MDR6305894.1 hypothetical protein [Nitrobacter vulgaris]
MQKSDVPIMAPDFQVANKPAITAVKRTGTTIPKVAVATFDPSSDSSMRTVAAHGLGVYIPAKAIITRAWVDVVTTFADGASDSATIALSVQGAGDLVAAIAISNASNVWDAGLRGTKVGAFALDGNALTQVAMAAAGAATFVKTTAVREITATVATAALTAGKLNVFVEYLISD